MVLNKDIHLGAYLSRNEGHSHFCSRTKRFFLDELLLWQGPEEKELPAVSHERDLSCSDISLLSTFQLQFAFRNLKLTQASSSWGFDLLRRWAPLGVPEKIKGSFSKWAAPAWRLEELNHKRVLMTPAQVRWLSDPAAVRKVQRRSFKPLFDQTWDYFWFFLKCPTFPAGLLSCSRTCQTSFRP